jgi:septal ring factor EnvC (AmiA/AmiB activator)
MWTRVVRQPTSSTVRTCRSALCWRDGAFFSAKVKAAVNGALDLKGKLALTLRELAQVNRQLNDIVHDQARLRANLKEMPPTAEAYKRYLKKFDDQETQIEQMRAQIKKLQDQEHQQRLALDAYLTNLSVE